MKRFRNIFDDWWSRQGSPLNAFGGGVATTYPIIGDVDALKTTWYPALRNAKTGRASISVIGDSITAGYYSTNWDTKSYVAMLRSLLQADYGNGGEGFLSLLHTDYTPGAPGGDAVVRWVYSAGVWTGNYGDQRQGAGAIAGRKYTNSASEASLVFTGDSIQVMAAHNHSLGTQTMGIYVDGILKATYDCKGTGIDAQLDYGQLISITGLNNAEHTLMIRQDGSGKYIFVEGCRPLIGTKGIVVDRFGKGWIRADWLGEIEEANAAANYFQALKSCVDRLDTDLFVVALGINDYINQVALVTFESRLTAIVARCKAKADCVILAMPQPDSSLTIPYSGYCTSMATVATAQSCYFLNTRARWSNVFDAAKMSDANHPNDAGHADIAQFVYESVI